MKARFIKLIFLSLKLLFLLLVVVLFNFNPGCRNPNDFNPPEDSLTPPPAPPELFHPLNDTVIPYWVPYELSFDWSVVNGAQLYELQISPDSTFESYAIHQPVYNSMTVVVESYGRYFWRVRAASTAWTWYTGFSETWHFTIRHPVK